MSPTKIKVFEKKNLFIQWDDNSESLIPLAALRKNCPCAVCVMERESAAGGKPASYIPLLSHIQMTLKNIEPVGTYAIRFFWQDGHDDGIYNYELLRELGKSYADHSTRESR
jgi:DUF971 family protein